MKGRGKEVYGLLYLGEKVAPERVTESSCLERIGAETPVSYLSGNESQVSGTTEVWKETSQGQG